AQLPEEKIQFGAAFALYPQSREVDEQVISTDPPITFFKNVLSVVDRAYLIFLSRPYLQRAHVIDPEGDKSGMVSDVRTSMSTYLPFEIVDIIGRYVELKIIRTTGEDLLSSEPMSILKYAPGEYYRPHVDFFDPKLTVTEEFLRDGGQRTASAVTYLVAPAVGGGTSFPNLNLAVPAESGGTLWFRNCLDNGRVDERSLHAGETVQEGEKWVVTKWFRERPTQYLQL
ncbi:MAG: 2OG-Fe(II) oxygenase, partial [Woeseiaceae bacterium]